MRKINLASLLILVLIGFACSRSVEPEMDEVTAKTEEIGSGETDIYKLIWEDRFNEESLNTKNWLVEVNGNGGGNSELQYYRNENISLGKEPISSKGCLIITAKKEDFSGKKATSGRLNTRDRFSVKYGKIEASIKLPKTANGLWPAFWMLGADHAQVDWPKCGEIDIMEFGNDYGIKNGIQDKYFNGALHWGQDWNGGAYPNFAQHFTSEYGLQDDFHLYTLIWDESKISMYLDLDKRPTTKPYFEMNITDVKNLNSPGHYFHKEFFIILNLAVGGNFTKIWDIEKVTGLSSGEAKMYVDFVKVYQKK